jgi:hypothetical protein
MTADHEETLQAMYAAFNARDTDAVLARMTADVDWPNAWEGGHVVGPDAVREYWTRQWAAIDPHVEPTAFVERPDGRVAVSVHQVVRALDGSLVGESDVVHVYAFREGLISRMDVEE